MLLTHLTYMYVHLNLIMKNLLLFTNFSKQLKNTTTTPLMYFPINTVKTHKCHVETASRVEFFNLKHILSHINAMGPKEILRF